MIDQHHGAKPAEHVTRKMVVDGDRTEQNQLRQLEPRARFYLDLLQDLNHDDDVVLTDAAVEADYLAFIFQLCVCSCRKYSYLPLDRANG